VSFKATQNDHLRGRQIAADSSAKHGAIVSATVLERPRLASSPPTGTLCLWCDTRTPLVETPMQAVSAGPRRAPRSIRPLALSSRLTRASRAG
jgi:hypothetical protein